MHPRRNEVEPARRLRSRSYDGLPRPSIPCGARERRPWKTIVHGCADRRLGTKLQPDLHNRQDKLLLAQRRNRLFERGSCLFDLQFCVNG